MALKQGKRQLVLTIDEPIYQDIVRISDKLGISKSRLAKNLLYAGLDDAKVMDKLGLVKAIGIFRGFSNSVNEKDFWSKEAGILLNGNDE
jgi:hypothetical protein